MLVWAAWIVSHTEGRTEPPADVQPSPSRCVMLHVQSSHVTVLLSLASAACRHVQPLMFMWERMIGTQKLPYWIRLPSRLPAGKRMLILLPAQSRASLHAIFHAFHAFHAFQSLTEAHN